MRLDLPKRAIIEAYESGLTIAKVAAQFGCSVPTVHKLLKKHNVPRRPQGYPRKPVDTAAIVAAYRDGASSRQISGEHGVGETLILRTLRRAGVVPRRGKANPQTTELRDAVVAEWNKGEATLNAIGKKFGIRRGVVGRLLTEARKAGVHVYTPSRAITLPTSSSSRRAA